MSFLRAAVDENPESLTQGCLSASPPGFGCNEIVLTKRSPDSIEM